MTSRPPFSTQGHLVKDLLLTDGHAFLKPATAVKPHVLGALPQRSSSSGQLPPTCLQSPRWAAIVSPPVVLSIFHTITTHFFQVVKMRCDGGHKYPVVEDILLSKWLLPAVDCLRGPI